ncbi:uncharacterized protein LOC129759168 [Uranotaenia lowii]|uniref:uncharacterized protein LOC129759168 n=1 Tax=Uranotaenia lowii TaxID=190385 RepID=UPI00247AE157|nr:uncharacterized protein LOC129759168 [Uranotaenia lowii]
MATNTGVNIFRDILRDSPCRMVYIAAQQNLAQTGRHKTASLVHKLSTRPVTAPITPSSLARAIIQHQLMDPVENKVRPATTTQKVKRSPDTNRLQKLLELSQRKTSPCRESSSGKRKHDDSSRGSRESSINRNPRGRKLPGCAPPKHPQPTNSERKSPTDSSCKICSELHHQREFIPANWQDRLSAAIEPPEEDINSRISKIRSARSRLLDEEITHPLTLQESLYLINEVHQHAPANSFFADFTPLHTSAIKGTASNPFNRRKKPKQINFEGGRIVDQDFRIITPRKPSSRVSLRAGSKPVKTATTKRADGPLRLAIHSSNLNDRATERILKFYNKM